VHECLNRVIPGLRLDFVYKAENVRRIYVGVGYLEVIFISQERLVLAVHGRLDS